MDGRTVEFWFPNSRARELAAAAAHGDANRVAALVRAGADPNAAGRDGITPLAWALRARSLAGVRALLTHGADPNRHAARYAALDVAAQERGVALLRTLLDAKGDPNARNAAGDPLLASAVMGDGSEDNARLLIERGADVNALSHGHTTPALLAADTGRWNLVTFLLERGADPTIPDETGGTIANTLQDEETGEVSGDPAQAGNRERVRRLLIARGVHFPAEAPAAVRVRVFGPDNPSDRAIARDRARRDSLARELARDSLARDSAAGRNAP